MITPDLVASYLVRRAESMFLSVRARRIRTHNARPGDLTCRRCRAWRAHNGIRHPAPVSKSQRIVGGARHAGAANPVAAREFAPQSD
jgi:hypothetical protein